jgi:GNAT superfamily N-acetyltransferase
MSLSPSVGPLPLPVTGADREALCNLMRACVEHGASIGYLQGMSGAEASQFWARIEAGAAAGERVVLVARDEAGRIIGTVQLGWENKPNGRHRAEVQKLMVAPTHRHHGLGTGLMRAAEQLAAARGIRLLFLDTSEGRSGAGGLYERVGYTYAGGIPEYALDPDGTPAKNAIYYKLLGPAR